MNSRKSEINKVKYKPEIQCRWENLNIYRLVIWAWMMSEISIMFAPIDLSHAGLYIHGLLHIISAIIIGIPLVYSEICISQYTNCDVISMWNFFPALRGVGYGSIFLVILKTLYIMVLTSWYLEYAFYAAFDSPPWFSCDEFDDINCMVKRVNVSIFQHCIETLTLFNEDCGKKTASYCFYAREIGNNNTTIWPYCLYPWKQIIACGVISFALFMLSIRKVSYLQIAAKLVALYVSLVMLVLFCVSLSTSGTWYATKIKINWFHYNFSTCLNSATFGFLSLGTGYGIINHITRDVPFRSPANMTAIVTTLVTVFITMMYALIIFSGIKTMSYFHGEEENVLELPENIFFEKFASASEIVSYFDGLPLWGFIWFSSIFFCLFLNLWILYLYLRDLLIQNCQFARRRKYLSSILLIVSINTAASPFFCSDLTPALSDATKTLQIISTLMFAISLYWIYGYNTHRDDITFMIGVKSSYFWKISWLVSPIVLAIMLFAKVTNLDVMEYKESFDIIAISTRTNVLLFYIFVSMYVLIILFVFIITLIKSCFIRNIVSVFIPTSAWGPKDKILLKSRAMFVPEIMTTEFLYRQIRIHGYTKAQKPQLDDEILPDIENEELTKYEETEWSALTSS